MRTAVILGASNVTFSLPLIHATLRSSPARPLNLFVAAGHGRSFGLPSTVLGRTLPSLLDCRLWPQLDRRLDQPAESNSPPLALITDVGNDLLYGASVDQILEWVAECLDRLAAHQARVVVTALPIGSVRRLSPARYRFFRRLMFPQSRLDLDTVRDQAERLDEDLRRLVIERNLIHIEQPDAWYSHDPIHLRIRSRVEAIGRFLEPLLPDVTVVRPSLRHRLRVWNRKAALRWRGGRRIETPQPALPDPDCPLWLY